VYFKEHYMTLYIRFLHWVSILLEHDWCLVDMSMMWSSGTLPEWTRRW